ncbi:MAG: hypothetical protein ACW99J_17880 [Candidatus Thorarchaeota archaeon]|jgi:hypothetical protein
MAKKTKKLSVKKLAERLNEVREGEDQPRTDPPPCVCDPISLGCYCGRFQWEMNRKNAPILLVRHAAVEPKVGEVYIISRPPESDIDYGNVPFRVWAKCEGRRVELDLVEEDENVKGVWWCWCDVSHITKQGGDEHWFPNDGLLRVR